MSSSPSPSQRGKAMEHSRRARRPARAACTALAGAGALLLAVVVALLAGRQVDAYVPFTLTNFQNEYACNNLTTRIVRPTTVADVQSAVLAHSHVMAVGGGWSWNQPFFCASNGTAAPTPNGYNASNLLYATYGNGTAATFAATFAATGATPGAADAWLLSAPPPANGPANVVMKTLRPLVVRVNETEQSVLVDAGVRTIDLLRYLADYVTPTAPSGWTLPAFPWFVFQTVGGAVSTGTHGSSITYHSLSSQVLELTVVLANGTLRTFSSEADPFLMRALRVSVGKLGIITHIKFRIVREMPVTRTLRRLAASEYLGLLRGAQEQLLSNGTFPSWVDETEWFWVPQRHEFLMVSYTRGDTPDVAARLRVLESYVGRADATTAYNTSLALLQDAVRQRGEASVGDWPLLSNVTFDPATNISTAALPILRRLNDTVINAPWDQEGASLKTSNASRPANTTSPASSAAAAPAAPAPADPRVNRLDRKTAPGQATASLFSARLSDALPQQLRSGNAAAGGNTTAAEGSAWALPKPLAPSVFYGLENMAKAYIDISRAGVFTIAANTTREALHSYLFQPEEILDVNIRTVAFDQYEVAMPAASMADCWQGALELLYGADNIDGNAYNGSASPLSLPARLAAAQNCSASSSSSSNGSGSSATNATSCDGEATEPLKKPDYGFRSNPLVRLTGKEDALLSVTADGPRMWLNIEDYLFYNRPTRRTNEVFQALYAYLRSDPRCGATGLGGSGARMHWGKAGWPDAGCWHGDKEYPTTWCDFGCAVRQLDPTGKFSDSAPDRWTWEGAPLDACCTPQGFNATAPGCSCSVRHQRAAADCPPAPYYTYR